MWLLSTDRAELHYFVGPQAAPGGYAILSHVWGAHEQTFQDLQALRESCASIHSGDSGTEDTPRPMMSSNPRDHVSEKIRQSCILAQSYDYQWIWNDTCCIDKSSSNELSEAINSMNHYYTLSEVCFAYLADVSPGAPINEANHEFMNSRWHKRGWTLQELIAPYVLVFVASDWSCIGTKHDLAPLLEKITQVPAAVLRSEDEPARFSVAQRMSWAKGRETTRPEDRAYSLLGIFQISMTTLYGEGDRAFARLQEKIMKTSTDTSLFAWGSQLPWNSFHNLVEEETHYHDHPLSDLYLLSGSPEGFVKSGSVVFDASCSSLATSKEYDLVLAEQTGVVYSSSMVSIPTYTITHYGVSCRIPVYETLSFSMALLFCSDTRGYLGLVLTQCPSSPDPTRPVYHIGWNINDRQGDSRTIRTVHLGRDVHALRYGRDPVVFEWRHIFLAHRPPSSANQTSILASRPNSGPFRISPAVRAALTQQGWEVCPTSDIPPSWAKAGTATVHAVYQRACPGNIRVMFAMGQCLQQSHQGDQLDTPFQHWASLHVIYPDISDSQLPPSHHCSHHHIALWPHFRKPLVEENRYFSLSLAVSFTPCPINPGKTMVLNAAAFEINERSSPVARMIYTLLKRLRWEPSL